MIYGELLTGLVLNLRNSVIKILVLYALIAIANGPC